ncbi:HAD family hydrolase [Arenibaculum sp.]|uniref:HAD family hydrolase n=1 Tax=Arenibaculum sp. TaxID=2865862 RepID=UPI002E0F47F0|nr:HAD family hydrolase [Arenibaculum sp.]
MVRVDGMRHANVLITDVDNTLFDWVKIWHSSFSAMLDELVLKSGISKADLISEIKLIHQRHGTSEYAFLIEEIPSLKRELSGEEILEKYDSAIYMYRKLRKANLKLYPGVLETLTFVKARGTRIIAFTESMAYYTSYRLKKLGLDGIIDVLYSPEDHDLPENISSKQKLSLSSNASQLEKTKHLYTPRDARKPDSEILKKIICDAGSDPESAVYVGDSLMKDVVMAQQARAIDVYAEYGTAHERQEYELLRKVTHWTEQDVEREKTLRRESVEPSFVLRSAFSELLEFFEFHPLEG